MHRPVAMVLLALGAIFGFGSGLASLHHHAWSHYGARAYCEQGFPTAGPRESSSASGVSAPAPVPAPASVSPTTVYIAPSFGVPVAPGSGTLAYPAPGQVLIVPQGAPQAVPAPAPSAPPAGK